jgi:ParB family chromosome partitioning protein
MQLLNIDLSKLSISALNMRHGKKDPDVSDILPSIRARGVLVPLLVRPAPNIGAFEIVAGRRRYHATRIIAQETGESETLPCAVMEAGDDAAALEASLIENVARLDPDEVSQWETYTRLIQKEARTAEQIAQTFGITELMVRRVLALGNLLPRIRDLYRADEINAVTVRHLTMATRAQQKDWLALYNNEDEYTPTGQQLKAWLFGGTSISSKAALFDLAGFQGQIITDLFGEEGYFADPEAFWSAQSEAVAAKRDALLDDGWADVEILETGQHFSSWEYQKTSKKDGGKVFITVSHRGDVEIHEGYLSGKDARRKQAKDEKTQGGDDEKNASRPEVSTTLQTYIDLHRHAATRAVLTDHPGVALRLMVAHAINGSQLWSVRVEQQKARNDAITDSVARSDAELRFDEKWQDVIALLDFSLDDVTVAGGNGDDYQTSVLFARLLTLSDADVLSIIAVVMGETLLAGSAAVEAVGCYLKVDMKTLWAPDDVFFELMRDRQVVNAVLRDIGGKRVADGNVAEKLKTQKAIIRDYVNGSNNRKKVENWVPKWMTFPAASYTPRPFPTLIKWQGVEAAFKGEGEPPALADPIAVEPQYTQAIAAE